MRRAASILLIALLIASSARAEIGPHAPGFAASLAQAVFATAFAFITPRALDPVTIPQLTLWGLRGLSALDPRLTPELREGWVFLAVPGRILIARASPAAEDANAWGETAAALAASAWDASESVRHAGTEGVIRSVFEEMFNHLDLYSHYTPPEQAALDRARRSGSASAGLTLAALGHGIVVRDVARDGPGDAAGIRIGELVLAVDGVAMLGRSAADVDAAIIGAEDTEVHLDLRGRDGRVRVVTVRRALAPPETVFASRVRDMLVLRITGFVRSTDTRVAHELVQGLATDRHRPLGVVLDLRGNRGGLLRAAVATADLLLDAGVIAVTAGRNPAASRTFMSTDGMLAADLPLVVVVDGRSASAAEILAAALADRGRAVVIGSTTFGKGLVQTIAQLPDGGELLLSWSRVLAPLGWPIQGLGVLPQVCTSLGEAALRPQLAALAQGLAPMQAVIARARRARAPVPLAESIEIRAACPAAEGRETDMATAQALVDNPIAYAAALLPPMPQAASVSAPEALSR